MKRKFAEILLRENVENGFYPGDEAAHRAAASLGDRLDAPTLAAIGDAFAFLERVGGQFHVVTLREKYRDAERVSDEAEGEWLTSGLALFYESRDARIVIAKEPAEAFGLPVEEFAKPATEIAVSEEEPTETPEDPALDPTPPAE
jgi:hypothetical protein